VIVYDNIIVIRGVLFFALQQIYMGGVEGDVYVSIARSCVVSIARECSRMSIIILVV
jgi:hypothetical protein